MSKPKTVFVVSEKGIQLPLPRRVVVNSMAKYLTDSKPVEILVGSWSRKRERAGDIVRVNKPKPAAKAKKSTTETEKAKG